MTVFFISDLHLHENFLDSHKLFIKFFNNLPDNTEAIYILGDLFEFWVDDYLDTNFLNNIKNILKTASQKFPIYFMRGNRDFLLGKHFAQQTKITILPDLYKLNLYGHNIFLMHGDLLCSKDKQHIYFTKIIRHPIMIAIASILPIKLKFIIANKLRSISNNKYKTTSMTDFAKYDVCQNTVEQIMQQYAVNILIHGHTHQPNIHYINNNVIKFIRIVLGDWHQDAKILEFNPDGYQLKTISLEQ